MSFQGRWNLCFVLVVVLTGTAQAATYFPANGAGNVNPDTSLRITFSAPPTLSGKGQIQIIDAATNIAVDAIDTSSRTAKKTIGGMTNFGYYPVIINGNEATIYPKNGSLGYGKEYRIAVDDGVFANEKAASWTIKTKANPPAAGTNKLNVAADGTGDFSTVQGAIDSLPDGNTKPITILIRKGTYEEIIFIHNKHAITLLGEDRLETKIQYANNERFNNITPGNPFGSAKPDPVSFDIVTGPVYRRGMLIAHRCNDLTIANLTLHNTTPKGGGQAEAILINGTTSAHTILKDVSLHSFQDTLQINGQAYLNNCYIEGDVDFMWGTGPVVFENCTCKSLQSRTYFTQIRNQPTNHGFVYIRSRIEGAPDVSAFLSRVDGNKYTHSEVVFMDCVMTDAVSPAAWQLTGQSPDVHYWEFNSHSPDGKPIDVSQRAAMSRQLKQPNDAELIKNYSDPSFILGGGWNPKSATIFTSTK